MKKLFFTAIALVAFSGVSMANTIEIEESPSSCLTEATMITNIQEENYHNAMAELGIHACFDSYIYNMVFNFYYQDCLKN